VKKGDDGIFHTAQNQHDKKMVAQLAVVLVAEIEAKALSIDKDGFVATSGVTPPPPKPALPCGPSTCSPTWILQSESPLWAPQVDGPTS